MHARQPARAPHLCIKAVPFPCGGKFLDLGEASGGTRFRPLEAAARGNYGGAGQARGERKEKRQTLLEDLDVVVADEEIGLKD